MIFQVLEKVKLRAALKDQFESTWLRKYFSDKLNIHVGLYSYGCFDTKRIPGGTTIGRYCSFSPTCYLFNGNHGIDFLCLHPYAYNPSLGLVDRETIERSRCSVGDDVWIGHNAIILPSVSKIGRGSIIAAGSVVTKDVEPYSVVAGAPAKKIRMRFDDKTIEAIEKTGWWNWSKDELMTQIKNNPDLIFRVAEFFQTHSN